MKHFTTGYIEPTNHLLVVTLDCYTDDVEKWYKREFKEECPKLVGEESWGGYCYQHNGVTIMVLLQDSLAPTLVHETSHAVGYAWEEAGAEEVTLSGEVFAYSLGATYGRVQNDFLMLLENKRIEDMIKPNPKGGYDVYNAAGTKKLGHHPTHKEAEKQIAAIEANKHKRGRK